MRPALQAYSTHETDPGDPPAGIVISAFSGPGRSMWGRGEAAVIDVPAPWTENLAKVSEALAAIERFDEVDTIGSGPVAFGALPFDGTAAATFTIPQETHFTNSEGQRWVTRVVDAEAASEGTTPSSARTTPHLQASVSPSGSDIAPAADPRSISVAAVEDPRSWCEAVLEARERIAAGHMTKVVLARQINVRADVPFDAAELFNRLVAMYPDSMCFAVDGFIGASPELLVSRIGEVVRAHPMAGTTQRSGDPLLDQKRAAELLASTKNRVEHQITIDMVHERLLPWCSYLDAEPAPSVVPAGPVQHLATLVEGRLSQPSPSVLDLVAALHPTPAVGGWPVDAALSTIAELEPASRGRYAGPVGWVDSRGNGAFAVAVRSAQLAGSSANLFAGVGIVEDSDPVAELEETRTKARALLGALIRV